MISCTCSRLCRTRGTTTLADGVQVVPVVQWAVERPNPVKIRAHVDEAVQAQEKLHQEVLERVRPNHARMRASESKGSLPKFEVGDHVGEARVGIQARRVAEACEHLDGTLANDV